MSEAPKRWYILNTLTGQEQKVRSLISSKAGEYPAMDLRPFIGRMLVPTEKVTVSSFKKTADGQEVPVKRIITKKTYPGYVFVELELYHDSRMRKLNQPLWEFINGIDGVICFLNTIRNSRGELIRPPVPLSEAEMAEIPGYGETAAPVKAKPTIAFEPGELVSIIDGPFAGNTGVVHMVDPEHGRLEVLVTIFGGETPVDLEYFQVERYVEKPKAGAEEAPPTAPLL